MKKRMISLCLVLSMVLTFAGCGDESNGSADNTQGTTRSPELTLPETRRIRKIPFREQRRKIRHRPVRKHREQALTFW